MKNKQITYFLIFLVLVIVVVIALNFTSNRPNNSKENPYEYDIDEYKMVDPTLIHYKETRQLKVKLDEHAGLATFNKIIYLASNSKLSAITAKGKIITEFAIQPDARAIAINNENVVVAYKQNIETYKHNGTLQSKTEVLSDSSVFTSVALWNNKIIVADAGKRRLYGFDEGKLTMEIEGVSGAKNLHGFIIPSPYFEIAVNSSNELWATNPGMHALQHYNANGDLLQEWDKISMEIEGFTGCCNPAQFTFLPDGRFVTSEKGMPRIKIHSKTGELESVVAAPSKFEGNQHAAEVATLGEIIVALDLDREMIRIFEPKASKGEE
ncbi:MAG: hypothetical protein PF541_08185 [Prolixibacteraceae bacterium]|jgi:hypothetical protein|nr:hypothetical protein [Prolixibacteraceae bacterium]